MTDAPPPPVSDIAASPETPPAARFERIFAAFGNLARPFTIYAIGYTSAKAVDTVAGKVENGNDGAIFLGAVAALVTIVIGARALENINAVRQAAKVDTAKARAGASE